MNFTTSLNNHPPQNKGKITVFYCGNPVLAKMLRLKCEEFGFGFKKEVF